jgi:hypothetical protein
VSALSHPVELPITEIQEYFDSSEVGRAVEFRLVYSGRLLGASRNDTRATHKHFIRREFHPQLARLWRTKPLLSELAESFGRREMNAYYSANPNDRELTFQSGVDFLANKWSRGNYKFVPLVTAGLCLQCSLDILFLRPEEPGLLIRSGDLDARVKTVFDALRVPDNLDEIGNNEPKEGETPFYCFIADDKLISSISVTTDQLLLLPHERQLNANDALLIVHIKLRQTRPASYNWAFG